MHMFDDNQQLKKYTDPEMMIDTYMNVRKIYYIRRKNYQLEQLKKEVVLLSNKARFILEQCNDTLDLRKKKKDVVIDLLKKKKYDITFPFMMSLIFKTLKILPKPVFLFLIKFMVKTDN